MGITGYAGINTGIFMKDAIIEEHPDAVKKVKVNIAEENKLDNVIIYNSNEVIDDGSIVFNVKSATDNKEIGSFPYMPWIEKKPIHQELYNGDIILGKENIYNLKDNKIVNLIHDKNVSVFDYDVYENNIAIIGKKNSDTSDISVFIKDIQNGKIEIIDSFKYPDFAYPEVVYLAWGKDGKLYYDCCENEIPIIKVFDKKTNTKEIYIKSAMNPQISPDGKNIVLTEVDSLFKNKLTKSELQMRDLYGKNILLKLDGSRKIFWDKDYLVVKNVDNSVLKLYSLNDADKRVKEYKIDDQPFEIKILENKIELKSYKFQDSIITERIKEIDIE